MVTQAPGANQETKLGGISIDGASAGENRFIVDGVETTNLQTGLSGMNVIADFVEEVQVKSSGFSAEFGGALGGVISAVTKSGTNNFSGFGAVQLPGQRHGRPPPSDAAPEPGRLRQGRVHHLRRRHESRMEPGFALGGPIMRDRLWFYAAYLPAMTTTDRTVNGVTTTQDETSQNITANISAQPANSIRARLALQQLEPRARGPAARAERHRPGRHQLRQGARSSRTCRSRATWTGSRRRTCCSASRPATA